MNVAVVGGGISGAVAAAALCEGGLRVTVFDQGRRGAGGRASHRSVTADATAVLADDEPLSESDESTLEFDHGCQFFRADEPRFAELVARWCEQGWAAQWCGRFHQLPVPKASSAETHADPDTNTNTNTRPKTTASSHPHRDPSDFFGLPESPGGPVYVGVGGMQRLVRAILTESRATLCRGQRVAEVRHAPSQGHAPSHGRWELLGTSGESAFHDTSVSATPHTLGTFDAVLFTDASSALGSWHRASAGLPPELGEGALCLFCCALSLRKRGASHCTPVTCYSSHFAHSSIIFWSNLPHASFSRTRVLFSHSLFCTIFLLLFFLHSTLELARRVARRVRVPLFTCMVALERPLGAGVGERKQRVPHLSPTPLPPATPPPPHPDCPNRHPTPASPIPHPDPPPNRPLTPIDGFTAPGSDALWFAARSQSKPGGVKGAKECWTLVSTPGYAVAQVFFSHSTHFSHMSEPILPISHL